MADRLQKWLANAGVASRRAVEPLIREGEVIVNGRIITNPAFPIEPGDTVIVRGQVVDPEPRQTYALHKPRGVISTTADTHGRPVVTELVPAELRLYTVGRLDADSEGLLLMTNDGALAEHLTHPRYEVPKTYRVTVRRPISDAQLRQLRTGVELDDGPTLPATVRRLGQRQFEITIREGRNRQIRRMGEAVGCPVSRLVRVAIGSLKLGDLRVGKSRRLSAAELTALRKA